LPNAVGATKNTLIVPERLADGLPLDHHEDSLEKTSPRWIAGITIVASEQAYAMLFNTHSPLATASWEREIWANPRCRKMTRGLPTWEGASPAAL